MSKVIVKISFKHPNLKTAKGSNVAHLNYIGTRPGVDKSLTETDLQKELSGRVVSENEDYAKYINERPNSHGLFDADGLCDYETVKSEISNNDGFVWRTIISLREEDALNLGYDNKEKWQTLLRRQMPDMANKMGIKIQNLRWVGAVHMEKGHPHAHVMIWEKNPEAKVGIVSNKSVESIRKQFIDEVFKDEKMLYINEKNAMRDLIRDFTNGEIGQITKLIKEVRETGEDLELLRINEQKLGLPPRLYPEIETELHNRVLSLASIMPGHGRAYLKFMPDNVKDEVRKFADYVLSLPQYQSMAARYINAVEMNSRLYTSDEAKIKATLERATSDIRDRISQVLLKAAVECNSVEKFSVNLGFAAVSCEILKTINNRVDLFSERKAVLSHIANALIVTGHNDKFIRDILTEYSSENHLRLSDEEINYIISSNQINSLLVNNFSDSKSLDVFLSSLKVSGYSDEEAYSYLKSAIDKGLEQSKTLFDDLLKGDYFIKADEVYRLSEKGIEEFLKTCSLDGSQREILSEILKGSSDFEDLYECDKILNRLIDKEPEELKLGRFDLRVYEEFGEINQVTFKDIERNIYDKYTVSGTTDIEKAEREIDSIERRIEKLCLYGYVNLNKSNNTFSFTDEGLSEIKSINSRMEFSLYDANVTLSYIDEAEEGILKKEDLKDKIYSEVANQTAINYYESFKSVINNINSVRFINIEDSIITATKEGKDLGRDLYFLNKFFSTTKEGTITQEKINEACLRLYGSDGHEQYQRAMEKIFDLVDKGIVLENLDSSYVINPSYSDIKDVLGVLYKAGGTLRNDEIKLYLEKNIPNREAEKHFNYLVKRLDNAKRLGYVSGIEGQYSLTDVGINKRLDLKKPQRALLRKEVDFLNKLGLLSITHEGMKVTARGKSLLENVDQRASRESVFDKDTLALINKTLGRVDLEKVKRVNLRLATGKYLNNEYDVLKTDYKSLRTVLKVQDLESKTISNVITTMHLSGMSEEEIKEVLNNWNKNSGSNIEEDKLNRIYDEVFKRISEDRLYGKTPFVSYKDWNEMFKVLGVGEPPKWIFSNNGQSAFVGHGGNMPLAYDVWKALWNTVESRRLSEELTAVHRKKAIARSASMENKAARKEVAKKLRSPGLVKDDEMEK